MIEEQKVERSVATEDAQRTKAGNQKNNIRHIKLHIFLHFLLYTTI